VRNCNFRSLKIWLYDPEVREKDRGYDVPELDKQDLEIPSNVPYSTLEKIYVLDNGLKGSEYRKWENIVQELFTPLFAGFVAPPEAPSVIAENPLFKTINSFLSPLDPNVKLKQNLWFNSLIIQID